MPRKNSAGKQNNTAVIYARYSSHNQKDASIEQQIAECTEHAKSEGLNVVDTYADRAITGKTDKRPAFQKMMQDASRGMFRYVLAWKSNRMGRNMLQAMMNEELLNSYGVKVLYAEEDFDDTAAGRFALRSMMNVNQFYSENMAEDITRGMMDNAKNCKANGYPPYGYKIGPDKRYEIDEQQAKAVREIYESVASGVRIVDIIRSLNERGIKTSRGLEFTKSSFNKILHNERYRGIYIFKDIRIEDGMPRIISEELFYKVQEALRMKKNPRCVGKRREDSVYLLTGKLFCGHCKAPMTGASGTSHTGGLFSYYRCQRRKEHKCDKKNVQKEWLEETIARYIYEYCLSDEIIDLIADKTIEYNKKQMRESNVGFLEDELDDINRRIGNFLRNMEAGTVTQSMRDHLAQLEDEQMKLNIKLNKAKANVISCSKEQLVAGLRIFRKGNVENKKFQADLFDTFLQAAFLYDKKLTVVFNFTREQSTLDIPIENLIDDDCIEIARGSAEVRPEGTKPHQSELRRTPIILCMGHGAFILHIPL